MSRWFYRSGKSWGDRFAVMSHADFVRALAADRRAPDVKNWGAP
jgi:hypothetical protein